MFNSRTIEVEPTKQFISSTITEKENSPGLSFKYIPSFDGIRCIAVFFVLLLHGSYGFFSGGWLGVDLFFVLSGYLITSLLKAEYSVSGKIKFSAFWIRRGLKLIPPLLVTIILTNIFWNFFPRNSDASRFIATTSSLFYFNNFIDARLLGPLSHLWSLSVEEHFYLCWPVLMMLVFLQKNKKNNLVILIIFIILISFIRVLGYHYYNKDFVNIGNTIFRLDPYRNTIFRSDAILIGCGLSFLINSKVGKTNVLFKCAILLFLILALFQFDSTDKWLNFGGFILTNFFCGLTVYAAIREPDHYLLSHKILRYFGKRFYGIYLYHFPIFLVLENFRQHDSISNFIAITFLRFLITFLVAELSYRYIEKPVLQFKKKFVVSKR